MEKSASVPTPPVNDDDSSAATKRPRLADSVSSSQDAHYIQIDCYIRMYDCYNY